VTASIVRCSSIGLWIVLSIALGDRAGTPVRVGGALAGDTSMLPRLTTGNEPDRNVTT
jgi:hypothetical protein